MRTVRVLFACSLLLTMAMPANAQFGALKKKIKDKVAGGDEKAAVDKPANTAKPNRFGQPELTATDLDDFIAAWKKEMEFYGLPQAQQDKIVAMYEAKQAAIQNRQDKWKECVNKAVSNDDMIDINAKVQQAFLEKIQADGTAAGIAKAQAEMVKQLQKEQVALGEKKCGAQPKEEAVDPRPVMANYKMKEFFAAYLHARVDAGAAKAAEVVLLTPDEAKLIEARISVLMDLAKQDKMIK